MPNICQNCGITNYSAYCHKCGQKIVGDEPAEERKTLLHDIKNGSGPDAGTLKINDKKATEWLCTECRSMVSVVPKRSFLGFWDFYGWRTFIFYYLICWVVLFINYYWNCCCSSHGYIFKK